MAKLLLSPLFLALLLLAILCVLTRPRWRTMRGLPLPTWLILVAITLGLGVLSTPAVSSKLALSLENVYQYPSENALANVDVVTVLSSGVSRDAGARHTELDDASHVRTTVGARTFLVASPRYFVTQGTLGGEEPDVMVRRMAELAIALGVPKEQVLLEARSPNTRAHPVELLQLEEISPEDGLAVVTSAWHLPRAMREFERYFDHVVPVPADYISRQLDGSIKDWIPQVKGLEDSTKVIHEWVGRLWYFSISRSSD